MTYAIALQDKITKCLYKFNLKDFVEREAIPHIIENNATSWVWCGKCETRHELKDAVMYNGD